MRHFVIGDIHGHAQALQSILMHIQPDREDRITFLGDYIDRGPDSRRVLDLILDLSCQVDALAGNHEALLLASLQDPEVERHWLQYGGDTTLSSFGVTKVHDIPEHYIDWIARCPFYVETDTAIFIHASLDPELALDQQNSDQLLWCHNRTPLRHCSNKRIYCGHTPNAVPIITPHWVSLDTGITRGGYLSCLEIGRDILVQADRFGLRVPAAA